MRRYLANLLTRIADMLDPSGQRVEREARERAELIEALRREVERSNGWIR